MSIIYALVGTGNRALRHSNSNNQIVIGDFNSYSLAKFAPFFSHFAQRNFGILIIL